LFIGPNIQTSDPMQPGATSAPVPPATAQVQLARTLHEARRRIGLSVIEAGQKSGISHSRIYEIEQALAKPTSDEIDALSRAYGLTIDNWVHMITLLEKIP
jgi:transcriptional regulator with XRE-family HTH domain